MTGNDHQALDCPYCWLVFYSRGALTRHINAEHWQEHQDALDEEETES